MDEKFQFWPRANLNVPAQVTVMDDGHFHFSPVRCLQITLLDSRRADPPTPGRGDAD